MKKLKVLILILAMMVVTTGVFTGCGDRYKNLSSTLSKDNVVLYLDEESNTDTVTLSLQGLNDGDSCEIVSNITNPVADIKIETDNDLKKSNITFTAISGGSAVAQFIHKDSNKIVGKVNVQVVKRVEQISQNTNNDIVVVSSAGTKVPLTTSRIINFTPVDTTQTDVIYSLKQQINGVSITENGVLTFDELYTGIINLTATVKDTNVSTDVSLKVVKALVTDNFNLSYSYTGDFIQVDLAKGLTLVNNRSLFKALDLKITSNYASDDNVLIKVESLDTSLVTVKQDDDTLFSVVTGDKKGQTKLRISAYLENYEDDTMFSFEIPVNSIKVPNNIKINDDYSKELNYDIYDNYQNGIGQYFDVEISDADSNDTRYALVVESGANNLIVTDKKGNTVTLNSVISNDMQVVTTQGFYVKTISNFDRNNVVIKVVALGSLDYDSANNQVITNLNLTLRKGVTNITFASPNNEDTKDSTYYLAMNESRDITFSIDSNEYSRKFTITTRNDILDYESEIISNDRTVISFDIFGKNQGQTVLTVTSENGVSRSITVRTFYDLQYFSISTDSYLDNTNIGSATYSVSGENATYGIQSLKHVAVRESKTISLNINKYDSLGFVTKGAEVYNVIYSTNQTESIGVTNDGTLYARRITEENVPATIMCDVYYYTSTGIKQKSYSFECEVYRAVTNITILSNEESVSALMMYYINDTNNTESLLYYYKDLMKKNLSYRLNPLTSSHISNITWEFDDESYFNIDYTNGLTISVNSTRFDEIATTTIYLKISQFGKTYIKRLPVTIIKIEEIVNFTDITFNLNGGNNKTLDEVDNSNIDYQNSLGQMYIDYRDIDKDSKVNLKYTISPVSATFNDVVYYYRDNDNTSTSPAIRINDDKSLSVLRAGNGKLYLIPKTKFVSTENVTNEILNNSLYINIKIADGLTEETAYELSTVEDLIKMNDTISLSQYRYYLLTNDIDVSRVSNWVAIGSNSQYGFRGQVKSLNGKYTIKGINLTKTILSSGESYGFFSKLTNSSVISDIVFEVQDFNIQMSIPASTRLTCGYAGVVTGVNENSTISNCKVTINHSAITFDKATSSFTAVVGGIAGQNKGDIEDCSVVGTLNVDLNSTSIIIANVGGVCGQNQENIRGNFSNFESKDKKLLKDMFGSDYTINSTIEIQVKNLKNEESSFGGIVGTNDGVVKGQTAEAKIYFDSNFYNSNAGGIVGINNDTIDDCTSVLTNKLSIENDNKSYLSSIDGISNIGGIVGLNQSGNVTNVIVLALDISNYFEDKSSIIKPLLNGADYVGGIVGYNQGGTLNTAYIKSYFVREKGTTELLDEVVYTIKSTKNAGAITGNEDNNANISKCYASNIYVSGKEEKVDDSQNNSLIVLAQPTEIEVNIVDDFKVADDIALLQYNETIENGHYKNFGQSRVVSVVAKNNDDKITENTFVNAFSNNNLVTYDYQKGIDVKSTGDDYLRFTSLLNNSLRKDITFSVIDNVSQFNFTKDIYKQDENETISNDGTISIKSGQSQNIYLDLKTETKNGNDDYLTVNDNEYQYTAKLLKLKFEVKDAKLFKINNLDWTKNGDVYSVTISALDKISIDSFENVSGRTKLTVKLITTIQGNDYKIETMSCNVEIYYGITDMHISSTSATISQKDSLELELIVDTDNNAVKEKNVEITNTLQPIVSTNDTSDNQSQFSKDYISVNVEHNKTEGNKLYYIAKISVSGAYENDVELNGNITFTATYKNKNAESKSTYNNQEKSIVFNLTVKKQKVENIGLSYFANAEIDSQGKYTINEVPTTITYPGSRGVLKVNVYPKEAVVEQVEVTYQTTSAYSIQLSQLLYNKENGTYQTIQPNAVNINNGIRFTGTSAYYDNESATISTKYDGNLFVGVGISGQCPEGLDYTITVRVTTNDKNVYQNSITLTTTTKPSIIIDPSKIENQSGTYYVAKKVSYDFDVNYTKIVDDQKQLDTIAFNIDGVQLNRNIDSNGLITYKYNVNNNEEVVITQKSITQTGQSSYKVSYEIVFNNIKKSNEGKILSYSLETSFTKTVNNIESSYKAETAVEFEVQKYVIRSINVIDKAENNSVVSVFRIGLGQTKYINVGFNVEYDNNDSDLTNIVEELTKTYSVYNGIWYATKDASSQITYEEKESKLQVKEIASTDTYFKFSYESGEGFKIYANNRNPNGNMLLSGGFYITYEGGVPKVIYNNQNTSITGNDSNVVFNKYEEIENNDNLKARAIKKSVDFELNIFDTSGPNNYVPINNVDDLLNDNIVQKGGYYRLTTNIVVTTPWTPLTKEIAVLDGNGYSIYLTNGFNEEYMYEVDSEGKISTDEDGNNITKSSVNLGLFDTITTNMAVYNVNVVLPYLIKTVDELGVSHYNDFSVYSNLTTLNVGYIAGVNNGIIYNCDAYSNAKCDTYSNATNSEEKETKSQLNTNNGLDYSNFTTKSLTQTIFNIGGLTGINDTTGYITNSRSHIVARLDRGIVGGLVATNNNVIASSFYQSPQLSDDTTTRIIVLSNNPTTEENSAIAGLVAINSGKIRTSYVEGYDYDKSTNKNKNGFIQSSIVTSGLVSTNSGEIENCYANIPVSGTAQTSGLVYSNSGTINKCVALSTLALKHSDHTPLIGTKNSGKQIQNTGTITNCYYLDNAANSDYSSNLMTVVGVTKITNIEEKNLPVFEFQDGDLGIWKFDDKNKLTLIDANDIESGHQEQTITIVTDGYVKYVWQNVKDETNEQIASYVVGSASDFNAYFKDEELLKRLEEGQFSWKVRIVRDIEFSKSLQPETYDLTLSNATIQGNGMNISNIYLPGDMITGNDTEINNFGLFSQITNGSTVKDLVMTTEKFYANNSKSVGVLAGTISGSNISNIDIKTNDTVIQGINFVGALAGTIQKSNVLNIDIQAKINANYTNKADTINNVNLHSSSDTVYYYSYAGALAGRILSATVKNVDIGGDTVILGYYTGAVAGYVEGGTITYAKVTVNNNAYLQARFVAGGLVAHNKGTIDKSQVTGTNENYYKGSPNIVGGLVGLDEKGTITNSFNTLLVGNKKVLISGGLVGVTLGGEVENSIMDSSIVAQDRAGGIIGVVANNAIMSDNTTDTTTQEGWFNQNYNFADGGTFTLSNCVVYNSGDNKITATVKADIVLSVANGVRIDCTNGFIVGSNAEKDLIYFQTKHISNVGSEQTSAHGNNDFSSIDAFDSITQGKVSLIFNLNTK